MAQIVDSLIVTLGLDPKNFTAGQKQAASSLVDMRKSVSDASADIGGNLLSLGKKFAAFFLGFEGLKGAIDLLKETAEQFKDLDISASVLGTSVRQLRTWSEASQLAGGSAKDAQAYILGMQESMANLRLQGQWDPRFTGLMRVGVSPLTAPMNDPTAFMRQIMEGLYRAPGQYGQTRNGRAMYGMTQLGLPQSLAYLLSDRSSFNKWVGQSQRTNSAVTDTQGKAALDLSNKMIDLRYKTEDLAAKSFPALDHAANELTNALTKVTSALQSFWQRLTGEVKKEGGAVKYVTNHVGAAALMGADTVLTPFSITNPIVGYGMHLGAKLAQGITPAIGGAEQYGSDLIDAIKSFFTGASSTSSAAHGNAAPGARGAASGSTQIVIGNVTINTSATDANGIAADLQGALERKFFATQSDNGVTQ